MHVLVSYIPNCNCCVDVPSIHMESICCLLPYLHRSFLTNQKCAKFLKQLQIHISRQFVSFSSHYT
jgi:hypothetical protein